jgi:hypothetical protein
MARQSDDRLPTLLQEPPHCSLHDFILLHHAIAIAADDLRMWFELLKEDRVYVLKHRDREAGSLWAFIITRHCRPGAFRWVVRNLASGVVHFAVKFIIRLYVTALPIAFLENQCQNRFFQTILFHSNLVLSANHRYN